MTRFIVDYSSAFSWNFNNPLCSFAANNASAWGLAHQPIIFIATGHVVLITIGKAKIFAY